MRVGEKVRANLCTAIDGDKAMQHRVAPDLRVFIHKTVRAYMGVFTDLRALGDHCGGMNSGSVSWRLVEKLDGSREIEGGVFAAQCRDRGGAWFSLQRNACLQQHGRRLRCP